MSYKNATQKKKRVDSYAGAKSKSAKPDKSNTRKSVKKKTQQSTMTLSLHNGTIILSINKNIVTYNKINIKSLANLKEEIIKKVSDGDDVANIELRYNNKMIIDLPIERSTRNASKFIGFNDLRNSLKKKIQIDYVLIPKKKPVIKLSEDGENQIYDKLYNIMIAQPPTPRANTGEIKITMRTTFLTCLVLLIELVLDYLHDVKKSSRTDTFGDRDLIALRLNTIQKGTIFITQCKTIITNTEYLELVAFYKNALNNNLGGGTTANLEDNVLLYVHRTILNIPLQTVAENVAARIPKNSTNGKKITEIRNSPMGDYNKGKYYEACHVLSVMDAGSKSNRATMLPSHVGYVSLLDLDFTIVNPREPIIQYNLTAVGSVSNPPSKVVYTINERLQIGEYLPATEYGFTTSVSESGNTNNLSKSLKTEFEIYNIARTSRGPNQLNDILDDRTKALGDWLIGIFSMLYINRTDRNLPVDPVNDLTDVENSANDIRVISSTDRMFFSYLSLIFGLGTFNQTPCHHVFSCLYLGKKNASTQITTCAHINLVTHITVSLTVLRSESGKWTSGGGDFKRSMSQNGSYESPNGPFEIKRYTKKSRIVTPDNSQFKLPRPPTPPSMHTPQPHTQLQQNNHNRFILLASPKQTSPKQKFTVTENINLNDLFDNGIIDDFIGGELEVESINGHISNFDNFVIWIRGDNNNLMEHINLIGGIYNDESLACDDEDTKCVGIDKTIEIYSVNSTDDPPTIFSIPVLQYLHKYYISYNVRPPDSTFLTENISKNNPSYATEKQSIGVNSKS